MNLDYQVVTEEYTEVFDVTKETIDVIEVTKAVFRGIIRAHLEGLCVKEPPEHEDEIRDKIIVEATVDGVIQDKRLLLLWSLAYRSPITMLRLEVKF